MLALKNWDINLRSSEKKTLRSFLLLYAFLSLLILIFVAILYYGLQKDLMLQDQRDMLSKFTSEQVAKLRALHVKAQKNPIFEQDTRYKFAIFDNKLKTIYSNLTTPNPNLYEDIYLKDNSIYFINELESRYFGAKYLIIEIEAPENWHKTIYQKLLFYGSIIFVILVVIGYFLSNILLQPMRNAITLLDRFIKDTTHELNTPINAILSNIEMIEQEHIDESFAKKIKRIKIASQTISNLYEDLTYLVLSHKTMSLNEEVDIKTLMEERIEYFSAIFESKKITVSLQCEHEVILSIDRKKITKLLDNIISNAIKYNKMGGTIVIVLCQNSINITDSGKGIESQKIQRMFERYTRFDTTVGGFGIGLSIVSFIAKEYGLHVKIDSTLGIGTTVSISW
ncbi:MAG: HAMP domain-containing sensor histidine kinase [Sulfurospirillaceae bacterium]|nr:HAMP domain-containing sensor histidine kinase [Sulfurospirillaceae bacterium]